ncbi:MAG TPA: hypothetical protein VHS29_05805, partial [Candidatus Acidoferrales bacterium]|nr:hypothetical protein [Candidatus Acidoferrales bacterium]
MRNCSFIFPLVLCSPILLSAQEIHTRAVTSTPASPEVIELNISAGTPLPVLLDKEVRIRKTGQEIHGEIAEPVYVFDKLV